MGLSQLPEGDVRAEDVMTEVDRVVLGEIASRTLLQSLEHDIHDVSWWHQLDLAWVPPDLMEPGVSFVTLERGHRLLGCVGALEPYQALATDVVEHTLAAAYHDPRFPAVTPDDVHALDIEISVLGRLQPNKARNIKELATLLDVGRDGLFVRSPHHRGTLLPSVWDDIRDPRAFIDATWRKAGIHEGVWPEDLEIFTYRVDKIVRNGPR
jgi:AmmeMemoRadiSam system protein A